MTAASGTIADAKALVRSLGPRIDDAVIEASIQKLADIWETKTSAEGIDAFLAKRPANWTKVQ